MDAVRAHHLGLVTELASPGDALGAALRCAEEVLACSPSAVRATKRLARAAFGSEDDERRLDELARMLAEELRLSSDRREGLSAFGERRPPAWGGY